MRKDLPIRGDYDNSSLLVNVDFHAFREGHGLWQGVRPLLLGGWKGGRGTRDDRGEGKVNRCEVFKPHLLGVPGKHFR